VEYLYLNCSRFNRIYNIYIYKIIFKIEIIILKKSFFCNLLNKLILMVTFIEVPPGIKLYKRHKMTIKENCYLLFSSLKNTLLFHIIIVYTGRKRKRNYNIINIWRVCILYRFTCCIYIAYMLQYTVRFIKHAHLHIFLNNEFKILIFRFFILLKK